MRALNCGAAVVAAAAAMLGCRGGSASAPSETVVVGKTAGSSTLPPPEPARVLREGTMLEGVTEIELRPLANALFVTAKKNEERVLYRVNEDALEPLPLPSGDGKKESNEWTTFHGHYPDHVYAIETDMAQKRQVLHQLVNGQWQPLPLPPITTFLIRRAVWWEAESKLVGIVLDNTPTIPYEPRIVRIDGDAHAQMPIPPATGQACNAFFTKGNIFPKIMVQPNDLYAAGPELFVVGYGCDGKVGAVSWDGSGTGPTAPPPRVHSIAQKTFMDDRYGGMIKGPGAVRYLWLPAMGGARAAALWKFDGQNWAADTLPLGDDSAPTALVIDTRGVMWGAISGKIWRRDASNNWVERPAIAGCEPKSIWIEKSSLWIGCSDRVIRINV